MDDQINITYIALSGYVELNKYRYFYFFIIFTLYVLTVCSNGTILYLIWIHKNLHEPMYIFIAALLFNGLLYSTNIYPKLLIDFLSEKPLISYSACILQFFVFYSVGCSEFLLLAAMAFDRYMAICKPLRYRNTMRKSTVNIFLILAWFVPACYLEAQAILSSKAKLCKFNLEGIFCNNNIYALHCVRSKTITVVGVVALLNVVILPMIFTVFTYANIFIISYKSSKPFSKTTAETCVPHLLVLTSYFCLMTYDVIIARVESDLPKIARFVMTMQIFVYHPLFNPFIYGFKMKEINKQFKSLFRSARTSQQ
ncbi:olfactory receptor 11H2-like [Girardinichthys multiradiatus]|uniref:olfactory receptor 11H2-like n=1 Tax=Girardinichthys multiradiatus TaxID=208333 RepID=UPI001FACD72D|nr:olfactory receptor 11H2-like [Girardinichthys multiradiatus]